MKVKQNLGKVRLNFIDLMFVPIGAINLEAHSINICSSKSETLWAKLER